MQARGGYAAMATHALNGLVGSADHVGGTVQKTKVPADSIPGYADYQDEIAKKNSKQPKIDQRGTLAFPALNKGKSGGGVVTNNAADAMLDEESLRHQGRHRLLGELRHVTTHASETSHFADVVLPAAHHMFEKWSFLKSKQNLHPA